MANLLDLIGRVFISSVFLFSGVNKILQYEETVLWMEQSGVPGLFLIPTIVLEIIAPILIIIGYQTRIAATLLALFCLTTAFIFHFDFSNQMQIIALLKIAFHLLILSFLVKQLFAFDLKNQNEI